jgi:RimJ/RimL family protein N-acetyltransferase
MRSSSRADTSCGHHRGVGIALQAPGLPLTDGAIRLRVPCQRDVAALEEYATSPGGLDGVWLPVEPGASRERLAWIVKDWLRGWGESESHNGPALLLDVSGASRFVGQVGFGVRADGVVELIYGVAPGQRGQGLATRATILATNWLIAERGVRVVELRIGSRHRASQRVADKAGFRPVGAEHQTVAGTGARFDDLRYVYTL